MKDFIVNQHLKYDEILSKLNKYNIKYYIDKSSNIVLLENKNDTLIYPHKMYITKHLSLFIDRYCSWDIYKILNLLLKLLALGILSYSDVPRSFYE